MQTSKINFPSRRPFQLTQLGGAMVVVGFPFSISLSQLGLFLAIVGWIWWGVASRNASDLPYDTWRMPLRLPRELKLGLALYGAILLSLLINALQVESPMAFFKRGFHSEFRDVFLMSMAFWVLAYSNDERGRKNLYRWLKVTLVILIGGGLIAIFSRYRLAKIPWHIVNGWDVSAAVRYQHHAGTFLGGTPLGFHIYMPVGFMGTHLTYAALVCFVFPYLFFRVLDAFIEKPRSVFQRQNFIALIILGATAMILMLNNGRSALLGMLFAIICGFYYFTRVYWKTRVLRLAPILLAALLAFGALYMVSSKVHARFDKIVSSLTGETKHTDWQRTLLWQATMDLIKEYPVVGVGAGAFQPEIEKTTLAYSKKNPRIWHAYAIIQRGHAHNDIFHFQAIAGIAGALLYVLLFLSLLYRFFSSSASREEDYWKWGVVTLLAAGLFQCYFIDDEVLLPFWLFTGLALSGVRRFPLSLER